MQGLVASKRVMLLHASSESGFLLVGCWNLTRNTECAEPCYAADVGL